MVARRGDSDRTPVRRPGARAAAAVASRGAPPGPAPRPLLLMACLPLAACLPQATGDCPRRRPHALTRPRWARREASESALAPGGRLPLGPPWGRRDPAGRAGPRPPPPSRRASGRPVRSLPPEAASIIVTDPRCRPHGPSDPRSKSSNRRSSTQTRQGARNTPPTDPPTHPPTHHIHTYTRARGPTVKATRSQRFPLEEFMIFRSFL